MKLTGKQRKYLRGIAHSLSPNLFVGKNMLTDGCFYSMNQSLDSNELIKVKFFDNKIKNKSIEIIELKLDCNIVGNIGKVLILYRQQLNPKKRKIILD